MVAYWTSFARLGRPVANGFARWRPYAPGGAYMAFRDMPVASTGLAPGMFELHERVVCRRRAAGRLSWSWDAGIISSVLPPASAECP
jgi:para-nitrobenzyl esterase